MQLIAHVRVGDYDAWRRAFDDDAESRGNAGLTLLQIWRQADDAAVVWMLYEVSERAMADTYFEGLGQLHAEQAGASQGGHVFLRTA
jgi:hypothetical protein